VADITGNGNPKTIKKSPAEKIVEVIASAELLALRLALFVLLLIALAQFVRHAAQS
jgi:hypothetical protein